MDTTKPTEVTHLSLCTGYGGIDLGLARVVSNLRTIAYCEREAAAIELLLSRMEGGQLDAAPIWTDLRSFPWAAFSDRVDILSGGYPCQPFSAAGKRLGAEDERHLWPAIADGVRLLRPRICFFENVEGHISLGLREVIAELEGLGYRTAWGIFSAAEVGAPHQRKRVFIMAHRKDKRLPQFSNIGTIRGEICSTQVSGELAHRNQQGLEGSLQQGVSQTEKQNEPAARHGRSLANTNDGRSGEDWKSSEPRATGLEQSPCTQGRSDEGEAREKQVWPSRPGEQQHWWEPPRVVGDTSLLDGSGQAGGQRQTQARRASAEWDNGQAEPEVGGGIDGAPDWVGYGELCISSDNRTDELRMLGNGVVPATAARAFVTLIEELL